MSEPRHAPGFNVDQDLLDAIEPGLTVFDANFELVGWNRPYERMGISEPGSLRIGLSLRENYEHIARRGIFGPGDPAELARERWEMAQSGRSPSVEDLQATDGRIFQIHRYFLPGIGVAALFNEVTELRRAEGRARRAESLAQLGRMTGGMAHDFNNLLAVIIGSLEVVQDEDLEGGSGVDVALAAAMQAADLCRTALAFAAPQSEHVSSLSVRDALLEVMRFVERVLPESIDVRIDLELDDQCIRADRTRFCNAIVNLALNARDAMPGGGEIRVSARMRDDQVVIALDDDGVGMDEALLRRVGEPFYTTKAESGGTGLGLRQVQQFVESVRGQFEFRSEPGRGTTALLSVPMVSAPVAPEPESELPPLAGRVLVVDDDPVVRDVVARMVESLGLRCERAASYEEAERLLADENFDIVLTDLMLAGERHGDAIVHLVTERHPTTRAIVTSGYQGSSVERIAAELPILPKPFTRGQLAEALARTLASAKDS